MKAKRHLSILILSLPILVFSQQKMTWNDNHINKDFIADKSLLAKIEKNTPNDPIKIYIEKTEGSDFSVYVLNNLKDSITIPMQDWHLFLIQEAKDQNGQWKPVEYFRRSWCGNSYRFDKFASKTVIETNTKAYIGKFETEIRFKLLVSETVYYSNSLKSKIDLSQFVISKEAIDHSKHYYEAGDEIAKRFIFLDPESSKILYAAIRKRNERFKKK
jgi:hypothetical protein